MLTGFITIYSESVWVANERAGEVGLGSGLIWEESGGSPGMFGWNLEFLCSEEGSDEHPEVTRRDFSGALEAAGCASRMKIWKR